ncbi:MAG: ABC transporter permease [Cyanobacteriota bacterium]|nr:ABC transporter permease [Cyanobacteriota bacterium]
MIRRHRFRFQLAGALWRNRQLVLRLTEREIGARYRGSVLGWAWSILTPLLMLAVYTVVFSQIFQARWQPSGGSSSPIDFAIYLFAGLIVFGIFAESIGQAPGLILGNQNYVSKVVFPLETLSMVSLANSVFHACTSLAVLMGFELIVWHTLPLTILWLPLVWLPHLALCLTLSWLLAAAGVFLRDIHQVVGVFVNMLLYLSAVFYPITALPDTWRVVLRVNPLAVIIEQTRRVAVEGVPPNSAYLLLAIPTSLVLCELGLRIFQRASRGFADVL